MLNEGDLPSTGTHSSRPFCDPTPLRVAGRDGSPSPEAPPTTEGWRLVFLIDAQVPCRSCGNFFPSSLMALVDPGAEGVGGQLLSLEQAEENLWCERCAPLSTGDFVDDPGAPM